MVSTAPVRPPLSPAGQESAPPVSGATQTVALTAAGYMAHMPTPLLARRYRHGTVR